jgi:uncharacterized membrane protein
MMIQIAIIGLSGLGFILAVYFAILAQGLIQPDDRRVPKVCRLEERSCARLLQSPDARILGVPNVLLGMLYYGGLILLAFQRDVLIDVMAFLVLVGLWTVALGIYLMIRLLAVHRVRCEICLATHLINFLLLITFVVGL